MKRKQKQRTIFHTAYRNSSTQRTVILRIACCNPPRSIQQFSPPLIEISVCSLLMAIQSLRMCIQSLQTEIFCLLRRKYKHIVQAISASCLRTRTALRETAHAFRAKKEAHSVASFMRILYLCNVHTIKTTCSHENNTDFLDSQG